MMKLAFLPAAKTYLGWFVLTFEQGKYSHVELVFSDGWAFSAVANEGLKYFGVRKIEFARVSMQDWEFVDLPFISPDSERRIRDYAEGMVGFPYDILSLLGYIFKAGRLFPNSYICSEWVLKALQYQGYWRTDKFFSPTALYNFVTTEPHT